MTTRGPDDEERDLPHRLTPAEMKEYQQFQTLQEQARSTRRRLEEEAQVIAKQRRETDLQREDEVSTLRMRELKLASQWKYWEQRRKQKKPTKRRPPAKGRPPAKVDVPYVPSHPQEPAPRKPRPSRKEAIHCRSKLKDNAEEDALIDDEGRKLDKYGNVKESSEDEEEDEQPPSKDETSYLVKVEKLQPAVGKKIIDISQSDDEFFQEGMSRACQNKPTAPNPLDPEGASQLSQPPRKKRKIIIRRRPVRNPPDLPPYPISMPTPSQVPHTIASQDLHHEVSYQQQQTNVMHPHVNCTSEQHPTWALAATAADNSPMSRNAREIVSEEVQLPQLSAELPDELVFDTTVAHMRPTFSTLKPY